ncbi:hypothetical protein MASR2M78_19220 [Treponema sp.]
MPRLIVSGVFLFIMIAFLAMNARSTTDINLFWITYKEVPTLIVALSGVIVGILYSIIVVMSGKLKRVGKGKRDKKADSKVKDTDLKAQDQAIQAPPSTPLN